MSTSRQILVIILFLALILGIFAGSFRFGSSGWILRLTLFLSLGLVSSFRLYRHRKELPRESHYRLSLWIAITLLWAIRELGTALDPQAKWITTAFVAAVVVVAAWQTYHYVQLISKDRPQDHL